MLPPQHYELVQDLLLDLDSSDHMNLSHTLVP